MREFKRPYTDKDKMALNQKTKNYISKAVKRVAVTGGAGFLGSHVAALLLQQNREVVVIDNFSNGKKDHLKPYVDHPRLEIIDGDITHRKDVEQAFDGCHQVIHLAVLDLRQSIKEPQRVSEVNISGTINCLEAALKNKVELFLHCSSSEVYGSGVYVPMNEEHPLRPETPYAASKVAQDMYVYSYGRVYGLPWTILRPFNMYGPNSPWEGFRGELIPKMIVRAMNGLPLVIFGDGDQTRDFVYVEEAARAVLAMVDYPEPLFRCLNFCSGRETSVRHIAEIICLHFGLNPERYIRREAPRPGDVRRHLGDSSQFKDVFGFIPEVGIEEGIRLTIQWFESLPLKPEALLSGEVLRNWE
jgi:UDP-glucose 4-epimerase